MLGHRGLPIGAQSVTFGLVTTFAGARYRVFIITQH
jgi:hypothetical protein